MRSDWLFHEIKQRALQLVHGRVTATLNNGRPGKCNIRRQRCEESTRHHHLHLRTPIAGQGVPGSVVLALSLGLQRGKRLWRVKPKEGEKCNRLDKYITYTALLWKPVFTATRVVMTYIADCSWWVTAILNFMEDPANATDTQCFVTWLFFYVVCGWYISNGIFLFSELTTERPTTTGKKTTWSSPTTTPTNQPYSTTNKSSKQTANGKLTNPPVTNKYSEVTNKNSETAEKYGTDGMYLYVISSHTKSSLKGFQFSARGLLYYSNITNFYHSLG